MSYIGNNLQTAFPSYLNIDDISGSFDGVTTSFPLTVGGVAPVPAPLSSNQCLISVGGVVQRPDDSGTEGFLLSGGNIVFSAAPTALDDFFGVILAGADYVNVGVNFPSGTATTPSITFDTDLDTGVYNPGANEIGFTTAGVNRVTIDSSGDVTIVNDLTVDTNTLHVDSANNRVGIGTTSPGQKLTVETASGNCYIEAKRASQSAGQVALALRGGTSGADCIIYQNTNSNDLKFYVNGSDRAVIDSSGRLLVGTTTAYGGIHSYTTTFAPNNSNWTAAAFVSSGGYGGGHAFIDGSAGYTLRAESSGANFYIQYHSSLTSGGTGGVFLASGAGSWSSVSDEREKINLIPIENGLAKIRSLRAVIGSYKWSPDKKHPFLLAQDVQLILPEAVSISNPTVPEEEQRLGMSYTDVVPLLVQALKEAAEKIESLEARLATAGI